MRGDFVCLHEPFGLAYYYGTDRRTTRPNENELDPTRSYASTWREILDACRHGRVFSKDFPNYVMHLAASDRRQDGTAFLDHFQHTFLIRDPAKVLPSIYAQWQDFTMDETSFSALHRVFDLVVQRYGQIPPVIDSDDLLDDPSGTVRAYCARVGIEFIPEALEWQEGDRTEVRWYGGQWHDSLSASTGLRRRPRSHDVALHEVPFLREMYARCRPHYDALAEHTLTPLPPA